MTAFQDDQQARAGVETPPTFAPSPPGIAPNEGTFWMADPGSELSSSGEAPGAGSTSEGLPDFQTPAVGRRVGRHILVTRLGAGRQSVVWRAVKVEPPIHVVALKVFAPEWDLEWVERVAHIRNEAVRRGGGEDSAILPVHETGEVCGHAYYTMPLIDGNSLGQALDRRREHLRSPAPRPHRRLPHLPLAAYLRAMASVGARVARALDDLHGTGFAHCDVKPDNILLDWADRPFLSDYGLSCALDGDAPGSQPARAMGTPLYMPREKLSGRGDVDERLSDVYSLGVTLYEATTLARPFRIPKGLPRTVWASFLSNLEARPPRDRQPRMPRELEEIILRAMHPDPGHRHPSARALAEELEQFAADDPARAWRA